MSVDQTQRKHLQSELEGGEEKGARVEQWMSPDRVFQPVCLMVSCASEMAPSGAAVLGQIPAPHRTQ